MNKSDDWCIQKHRETNHLYDKYLPYELHLRMSANVADRYKSLLDNEKDYYTGYKFGEEGFFDDVMTLRRACLIAIWGHDLLEDTRCSFGEIKNELGPEAADIIYAVTNEKGRNREEKANSKYYEGIRNTKGADFVKLCDRIANVEYSKMTRSRMLETYRKENERFLIEMGGQNLSHPLLPMFDYLCDLFRI